MKTDRELLMLAAKAAGIACNAEGPFYKVDQYTAYDGFQTVGVPWNPIIDDGDEARLEAHLGLCVTWYDYYVTVGRYVDYSSGWILCHEHFDEHGGDRQVARRHAGVRAAANIGKITPA